jgi:hypothetical protein
MVSTSSCSHLGRNYSSQYCTSESTAFTVVAIHLNLACDLCTLAGLSLESGLIEFSLVRGLSPVHDWICIIVGILVSAIGLASSGCAVVGLKDRYTHFDRRLGHVGLGHAARTANKTIA